MGKSFLVCSGKGGVGKTTVTVNLGVALAALGRDVLIIDANLPTPNIGLHLRIPPEVKTLNDVIKEESGIDNATFLFKPHLRVIPAAFAVESLQGFDPKKFRTFIKQIEKQNELTLIDCAPGLGIEVINALKASEQAIIVTNPEVPALADATKAIQIAQDLGVKIAGIIVNRTERFRQELSNKEISSIIKNIKILGNVPEDPLVADAIASGQPVILKYPFSPVSFAFKQIAAKLVGEKFEAKPSIVDKIKAFIARRK